MFQNAPSVPMAATTDIAAVALLLPEFVGAAFHTVSFRLYGRPYNRTELINRPKSAFFGHITERPYNRKESYLADGFTEIFETAI